MKFLCVPFCYTSYLVGMPMIEVHDSLKRSVAKAVSWRFFSVCFTVLISFLIIGSFAVAATIGVIDTIIKLFAYLVHERVWDRISFGREEETHKE